jgi:hypothetical protein
VKKTNILEEANVSTSTERMKDYGHPSENMSHIAMIASAILGREISYEDVVVIMIATKLSRQMNRHKRDNLVDLAGYSWVWSKCEGED